jgi:PAS domain S-box-containing protein
MMSETTPPETAPTGPGGQPHEADLQALAAAFEEFTRSTRVMEESYRRLEARIQELDQELAEKNRELAVTGEYLGSILNSMNDGVVAVDVRGVVTAFNRAAADTLGHDPAEVTGRAFNEVFGRAFAAPHGRRVMELRARDGRPVTVSEKDSPMSDRDGVSIGHVKVFQDLTEIEDLRRQVRQKDRLAAIGEMAATVAHEIRNPLGGIRGFAALLARDLKDDPAPLRLVEKILRGAGDLEQVVGELLEYTRPLDLRVRTANCADLVDAALGYIELEGRPVALRNDVPPGLDITADPDRIRQVFLNILLNAVQSIDGEGEVRATAGAGEGAVHFKFSDTGCGMTPDQAGRVFMPFYTTKEKGTGLGLAVAAKIVESHGGRIEVSSKPGEGSTFTVVLPATG